MVCRLLNIYRIYRRLKWNFLDKRDVNPNGSIKNDSCFSIFKPGFHMSGKSQTIGDFTVSRLSQILRLMKTRNRRYPRSSGMDGDKSGESGAFLFSRRIRRRVPDFCDGRRSFPTNEFVPSGTSAMNFAHYQSPKLLGSSPLSQINKASLGQTWGDYLIYRQNRGRSAKSKIPDRLRFFRHMKLCEICYFFYTLPIAVFFKSFLLKLRKSLLANFCKQH